MNPPTPTSDVRLASVRGRAALAARAKPYWEAVEPGLYLGLYKGTRGSTWYGRKFMGSGKYRQLRLGKCRETDRKGSAGLGYEEALQALMRWHAVEPVRDNGGAAPRGGRAGEADHALAPSRLDKISVAWAAERPDIDFWLAGFFLRLEFAHVMRERRIEEMCKELGVNSGDLHVLLALRRNGVSHPMRPTDLFRELLVTSGAVTKRLDRLREARMVERVAAADDRRSELVQLTPAGRRLADAAMTRISNSLSAIVRAGGVTEQELREVDGVMRRLIAQM